MLPISDPDLSRKTMPYVTISLIVLNIVVFIYELTLSGITRDVFFLKFGVIPSELANGVNYTSLIIGYDKTIDIGSPIPVWGTIVSAMFIHGGLMHIIGNMLFLWVLGDNVEDKFGHVKYLIFYLSAGVGAAWAQIGLNTDSQIPVIGASGAIAGVMGAYLTLFPYSRINTLVIFYFITIVRIPALLLLGLWIVLQVLSGIGSFGTSTTGTSGVAYWAHMGGFVIGVIVVTLGRRINYMLSIYGPLNR